MDYILDENRPDTCKALGLDCRSCIQKSAAIIAHICHGLQPDAVRKVFAQIYTSPGCAHMVHTFEAAYYEASAPARRPVLVVASAGVVAAAA